MNPKKYLETRIRGWLPKEQNLPTFQRTMNHETWSAHKWFAVLIVSGTFVGALLGALGYFLGLTSGIGLYVWSMIVGIVIGISVAVVAVRKKRKEEQQRS
jgi:F0F1-type ATP synthase assembly protein I